MADVFYTILIIWVLWKVLGGTTRTYVFHKHTHTTQPKKDGEVSVSHKQDVVTPKQKDKGEYIDYEEIK